MPRGLHRWDVQVYDRKAAARKCAPHAAAPQDHGRRRRSCGAATLGVTRVPRIPLVECFLLDPRPVEEATTAPIVGAANIPLSELPRRTHELPPPHELLPVAGPPAIATEAVGWLSRHGREAIVAPLYQYADPFAPRAVGRLWRPAAFLVEVAPQLSPGRALDLACGCGREAVYLASWGWQVTAVDVLPDAIVRARDLAGRCAAAIEPIDWVVADLERGGAPTKLGFVVPGDSPRRFDLIVGFRYLHRPLITRLAEWLVPGGSVVWETFTTLHRQRHGKPASDAHVLRPGELPTLLSGLDIRHHSEEWHGDAHTARIWGRRG